MKKFALHALKITICVSIALAIGLMLFVRWCEENTSPEFAKLYLDAFKIVVVGGGVALLGILIPAVFAEARHAFEKLKESRIAYSKAKTGVDYLPIELCTQSLDEAASHVKKIHVWKHQAELYEELAGHLKNKPKYGEMPAEERRAAWGNDKYDQLYAIRVLLEKHAHEWDKLEPHARLKLLLAVQPSVKEGDEKGHHSAS
jgi:hypothetical protein